MLRYIRPASSSGFPPSCSSCSAVYALAFYGAGDPIKLIFLRAPGDVAYNPERIEAIRESAGLNRPFLVAVRQLYLEPAARQFRQFAEFRPLGLGDGLGRGAGFLQARPLRHHSDGGRRHPARADRGAEPEHPHRLRHPRLGAVPLGDPGLCRGADADGAADHGPARRQYPTAGAASSTCASSCRCSCFPSSRSR